VSDVSSEIQLIKPNNGSISIPKMNWNSEAHQPSSEVDSVFCVIKVMSLMMMRASDAGDHR
jgi:hypothetical protein